MNKGVTLIYYLTGQHNTQEKKIIEEFKTLCSGEKWAWFLKKK